MNTAVQRGTVKYLYDDTQLISVYDIRVVYWHMVKNKVQDRNQDIRQFVRPINSIIETKF